MTFSAENKLVATGLSGSPDSFSLKLNLEHSDNGSSWTLSSFEVVPFALLQIVESAESSQDLSSLSWALEAA